MGRKLELKKIPFGDGSRLPDGTEPELDYKEQLLIMLRAPKIPQLGITYGEMELRLSLIHKLKGAGEHILLSDEEWREVRDAFKVYRFRSVIEAVFQMGKDIDNAPVVKLEQVEKDAAEA